MTTHVQAASSSLQSAATMRLFSRLLTKICVGDDKMVDVHDSICVIFYAVPELRTFLASGRTNRTAYPQATPPPIHVISDSFSRVRLLQTQTQTQTPEIRGDCWCSGTAEGHGTAGAEEELGLRRRGSCAPARIRSQQLQECE